MKAMIVLTTIYIVKLCGNDLMKTMIVLATILLLNYEAIIE